VRGRPATIAAGSIVSEDDPLVADLPASAFEPVVLED
jgi:hypothetical protein